MSKPYEPETVPPPGDLILGMIEYLIEEAAHDMTGTGKFCAKFKFVATAPEEVKGRVVYATETIGTEDDPLAEDPLTLGKKASVGMRLVNEVMTAARIERTRDLEIDIPACQGHRIIGNTKAEADKDRDTKEKTGEYRSRVRRAFPEGSKPLYVQDFDEKTGRVGSARSSGQPSVAAVAAAAPTAPPAPPPPAPAAAAPPAPPPGPVGVPKVA